MTIGTLIYLLVLAIGLLLSVLFYEFSTVAIIGLLAAMPIFMLIFLIFMRTRVSADVECKNMLAEMDELNKPARATITINIENRNRFLPITKGIAKVAYENRFSGEKGTLKVRFSVDGGKKRSRRVIVLMENCGNLAITVKKIRLYDYLNIFAWTIGKNYETQNVLVLPPLKEMYLGKDRWYNETNEDSDRFSLYKKGDDPSEIFDIREFMDGDKIQRIHWKLSSKVGQLMVKEGSLPLTKAISVFIDLSYSEKMKENINLLIQGVYSIAMFFTEKKIPQRYIWDDVQNGIIQEYLVEQEEEIFWMFQELFKCNPTTNPNELIEAYLAWEEGKTLEQALYLTVTEHTDIEGTGLVRDRLEVMDLRGEIFEDEE